MVLLPQIVLNTEVTLIGMTVPMSFSNHNPYNLWHSFKTRLHEISNITSNEYFSLEIYPDNFFDTLDHNALFTKAAGVKVSAIDSIPQGMEKIIIPAGKYAIFTFKGTHENAAPFYTKIFTEWLPSSEFELDNRPHFAVMGEKYKRNDSNSEEDIYIPIKKKC